MDWISDSQENESGGGEQGWLRSVVVATASSGSPTFTRDEEEVSPEEVERPRVLSRIDKRHVPR